MEALPRHPSMAEVARDKWTDVVTSFRSAPNSLDESPLQRSRKSRSHQRYSSPMRQNTAGPAAFGVTLRRSPSSSSETPPTSQPPFAGRPFMAAPCNTNASGAATAAEAATAAASSATATIESVIRVMFGSCASAVPTHQPPHAATTYNASDFYVGRASARRRPSFYGDPDDRRWGQATMNHGGAVRAASVPRGRATAAMEWNGDGNYYASFYADDHARAALAVRHLREKDESQRSHPHRSQSADPWTNPLDPASPHKEPAARSPMRRSHSERASPVSTPQRRDQFPYRVREVKSSVPQVEDDDDDERTCFDDGISALSAVTLEEMARRERLERRAEMRREGETPTMGLTQVPSQEGFDVTMDTLEEGDDEAEPPSGPDGGASPAMSEGEANAVASPQWESAQDATTPAADAAENMLSRVRSVNTRDSRRSRATHTSQSTNTTEFASVWRRDERKYWEEVVKSEEDVDPEPEKEKEAATPPTPQDKSNLLSTTLATTATTPDENRSPLPLNRSLSKGSETLPTKSLASSFDSPPRHPHETIQLSAKDCLPVDSGKKMKKKKGRSGGLSGMLGMGRRGRYRKPGRFGTDEDDDRYPVAMGTTASDDIGEI